MALGTVVNAFAEDGHSLWLRMKKNTTEATVTLNGKPNETTDVAVQELKDYWHGGPVTITVNAADTLKSDGYRLDLSGETITISSKTSLGALYGAYALLRYQETTPYVFKAALGNYLSDMVDATILTDEPKTALRILNHWDNPNGTVERGFSGRSIFWKEGSVADLDIIREYARANASVGINATVLNNVNAKPLMLSTEKLSEVKRIADVLRPYGIRVFLSVNFASPKALGGLPTADPLDKAVCKWWKNKVKEIYKSIPNFGGFLVKANSEGEPGPMDYGRTHVDGANMLADALKPYGGIVMWRSFVYSPSSPDRASQAYDEFMPLDGQFRDNVIIQVKNGPVDFQPREPVSPLFFGLKKTPLMPEFQITQEYLGESIHSVFLPKMWEEFFKTLKVQKRAEAEEKSEENEYTAEHPVIEDMLDESDIEVKFPAIAGVANIGDDRNWCGSDMAQANWYGFARMAWDPQIRPEHIASEWIMQTFGTDAGAVGLLSMLMQMSHETAVTYMMPMGLHHIFAGNHHYGPEPWCDPEGWREDWKPKYYHRADSLGIGFDRTIATGSKNIAQYPEPLRSKYENIETCPLDLILWFHHVPWDYSENDGLTLWESLCKKYDDGVFMANIMSGIWHALKPYIDPERHAAQAKLFDRQALDAQWWRDACLLYFQQFSGMPLPTGSPAPKHTLDELMKFNLPIDNYTRAPIDKLP